MIKVFTLKRLIRKLVWFFFIAGAGVTVSSCQFGSEEANSPDQQLQTAAHEKSAFAIIDPTYCIEEPRPEPDIRQGAPWRYGAVELECWRHQLMRVSSKEVARHGHYPGVYHEPFTDVTFRFKIPEETGFPCSVEFKCVGDVVVKAGQTRLFQDASSRDKHQFVIKEDDLAGEYLTFELSTQGEPPGLLVETGSFSTANENWEWKGANTKWQKPARHAQTRSGVFPHLKEIPEVEIRPVKKEGVLYDFGRELIGYVSFTCDGDPSIIVGESVTEALDTVVTNHEQTLTLDRQGKNRWVSKYPLAFRYLHIPGENPSDIKCHARFWPAQYKGAFACSDERLTRIWMVSAYTHRLTKYHFMLDGLKRDRLPWIDNMKTSSAVEAYTFADPELIKRTISVLGRASDKSSINGIVDYDALWIISQDAFQLYFDDPDFLKQEWPRIVAMIERKRELCDENGLLSWPENAWLFIDWVSFDRYMSEQIMWYWAQRSAIRLAKRMEAWDLAGKWQKQADHLAGWLHENAWDEEKEAWTDPVNHSGITRHANLLSMVSRLSKPYQYEGVMNVITGTETEPLNSPSMISYQIHALAETGSREKALTQLREIWGAMLDFGATTFWEGFDPGEKIPEIYRFYGRPYGKSMCHGWAADPVTLLPKIIFGIKPESDGWKTFSLNPDPSLVEWANATIPTKYGNILVELKNDALTLFVPDGTSALLKGTYIKGPRLYKESLDHIPASR